MGRDELTRTAHNAAAAQKAYDYSVSAGLDLDSVLGGGGMIVTSKDGWERKLPSHAGSGTPTVHTASYTPPAGSRPGSVQAAGWDLGGQFLAESADPATQAALRELALKEYQVREGVRQTDEALKENVRSATQDAEIRRILADAQVEATKSQTRLGERSYAAGERQQNLSLLAGTKAEGAQRKLDALRWIEAQPGLQAALDTGDVGDLKEFRSRLAMLAQADPFLANEVAALMSTPETTARVRSESMNPLESLFRRVVGGWFGVNTREQEKAEAERRFQRTVGRARPALVDSEAVALDNLIRTLNRLGGVPEASLTPQVAEMEKALQSLGPGR